MSTDQKVSPETDKDVIPPPTTIEDTSAELKNKEAAVLGVVDENVLGEGFVPASPEEQLDALGIPNWRELERKIVRRLDMTLMPCLWVLYLFNYLDRSSIAQARISSLDADLNLAGYEFNTAVSILTVGYVIGQVPSNMIIGKLRPSVYLTLMACVWSGVSAATCGVKGYEGLVAVRFVLGLVEAPLFPGAIYVMSCWYTRRELALRCAILYTGQTLAYCFAGLIAAGIFSSLEGARGLAGWQWLFIILASVGAFIALICLFILPDYPHSSTGSAMWSMTQEMRDVAAARIVADRPSLEEAKGGAWHGLKLCLLDYKMYILGILNIGLSAAYGVSNFYPSIVRGFGYSDTITLVLTAPPYLLAAIISLINARHSDIKTERGYHYIGAVGIACIGYIICLGTTNGDARYGASFIFIGGMYTANPLTSTWCASTMNRTPEKRATAVALFNIIVCFLYPVQRSAGESAEAIERAGGRDTLALLLILQALLTLFFFSQGQIGNFAAPYFFDQDDEPRYQLAFILMMVMAAASCSAAVLLRFCLKRENRKMYERSTREGTVYQPFVL